MGTWSEKILRRWNKYFGNLDNSYCTFLMINCSFNFFYQHLFDKNRKPLYIWHIFSNGNVFENGVCIYIYIYIYYCHTYIRFQLVSSFLGEFADVYRGILKSREGKGVVAVKVLRVSCIILSSMIYMLYSLNLSNSIHFSQIRVALHSLLHFLKWNTSSYHR